MSVEQGTQISIARWISDVADMLRDEMLRQGGTIDPAAFRAALNARALDLLIAPVLATGRVTPEFRALVALLVNTQTGAALAQTVQKTRRQTTAVPPTVINLARPGETPVLRPVPARKRRSHEYWLEGIPGDPGFKVGRAKKYLLDFTIRELGEAAAARWKQVRQAAVPPAVFDWARALAVSRGATDDDRLGDFVSAVEMDEEAERLRVVESLDQQAPFVMEGQAHSGTTD